MSILDELEATRQQAHDTTLREYREIVARLDDPQPTDKAKLAKLLTALGLATADVAADVAVLKAAAKLSAYRDDASLRKQTATDALPDALANYRTAEQAELTARQAVLDARKELARLDQMKIFGEQAADSATAELAKLRAANPRML